MTTRRPKLGKTGRVGWPVLILLVFGWMAQLPFVHQIHLAFDNVEHIWCPWHQRLEHVDAQRDDTESAGERRRTPGSDITSANGRIKRQACPLSLMHQVTGSFLQISWLQIYLPERKIFGGLDNPLLFSDVLYYAPKLSPPFC